MPVKDILILGAGPCGMSAAIALSKLSVSDPNSSLRITLVELRPGLATIGGSINMTPLGMRYLDYLGVGSRLRPRGIGLKDGCDYISLRTGTRLGNFWGGIDAMRVARHDLVESLLQTIAEEHAETIEVQWGRRAVRVTDVGEKVEVEFDDGGELTGDVLLGCDGLHSAARRLWVEPERKKEFIERAVVMGWSEGIGSDSPMTLATGEPALRDTTLISGQNGIFLASYYEPSRRNVYLSHLMRMEEPTGDARDGWKVRGNDKERVKREVVESYQAGKVKGLQELVATCDEWDLYPVYILPAEGRWHRGRVLLMGDAAHAMPPQGESTGLAIEDGVLLAHVFERRHTRTTEQLFSDFEALRKPTIDNRYRDAVWGMKNGQAKRSWFAFVVFEWITWIFLYFKRWSQENHFSGDVRSLELPP